MPDVLVALAQCLEAEAEAEAGVRPADPIVSVVTSTGAEWSFGLGRAQFLEGDL